MVLIAVYGMLFGLLAHFRKNLRPGMMAHTFQDAFSGIMFFVLTNITSSDSRNGPGTIMTARLN